MEIVIYDPVTGLATEPLFLDRLQIARRQAHRTGKEVAVVLVSLDGIECDPGVRIGDTIDPVRAELARRLIATLRADDSVAVLTPRVFAVIATGIEDSSGLHALARRLHTELAVPIALGHALAFAGVSIGATLTPPEEYDVAPVLARVGDAVREAARMPGRTVSVLVA